MNRRECTDYFYRLVHPSHPNEWEVEDVMQRLSLLDGVHQDVLFSQVPAIWPVSHSLCLAFLEEGAEQVESLPRHLVPEWVRTILAGYETKGLVQARRLIASASTRLLEPERQRNTVRFSDVSARLTLYVRGLSGRLLDLDTGPVACTDTATIYLPPSLSVFSERRENETWYKILVTLHWGFVRQNTLATLLGTERDHFGREDRYPSEAAFADSVPMVRFFNTFEEPELAADLFFIRELHRVVGWLDGLLPGLARQVRSFEAALPEPTRERELSEKSCRVERLTRSVLFGSTRVSDTDGFAISGLLEPGGAELSVEDAVGRWYTAVSEGPGSYRRPKLLKMLGTLDFRRATAEILKRRSSNRERFIALLAEHLRQQETINDHDDAASRTAAPEAEAAVMIADATVEAAHKRISFLLDNEQSRLPEELQELAARIEADLGRVPESYVSAAAGIAGRGRAAGPDRAEESGEPADTSGARYYDEWDYRRNGYRAGWCRLVEKDIAVTRSSFVASTLENHRGLLLRLKRQFEQLRLNEQFVGRQREGDDFDLDAIVDARADLRAGSWASDRLFVRLLRNNRDIVTVFLVDMSNSTEGWVGTLIKESLVLLCHAMETIGDRYGIYGFSGMRRSRCEIYPIKRVAEPYSRIVPDRIGSMRPREYTRMGPAIRHAADILKTCEARTRLLVALTDGKPEDYDDYRGEYAIEDTRKALLEARGRGMHTFCITVDREAHAYLPHMFGSGNHLFIDDIAKLPSRLIDMYRLLTA